MSEPMSAAGVPPQVGPGRISGQAAGVSLRAVLVGVLAVVVLSLLSPVADVLVGSFVAARNQAPALATLLFFGVVFVNLLSKFVLRHPLNAAEQMVVYCMLLITAGIPSTGLADYLIPHLVGVFNYATAENDFAGTFFPYIPEWLVPSKDPDSAVVSKFFMGGSKIPWQPWIQPLTLWSAFFLAMYVLQFCMSSLLRKQWVERERLVFPLIQLPLSLVQEEKGKKSPPVLRDPLFWGAAVVIAALYTYNSMSHFFPFVKPVPLVISLTPYVPESIRTHVGPNTAYIYPTVVAFFYFATVEVSFSVAFFYLYMRTQQAVSGLLGVDWFTQTRRIGAFSGPASAICQETGAVIVMVLFGLFVMRHHIRDIVKNTFMRKQVDDSHEALPYRWSLIGIVLGLLYLSLFLNAAGMSFGLAVVLMILLCFWLIVLSRMVADGGLLWGQIGMEPYNAVKTVIGTRPIAVQNWTIIGFCYLFMIDMQAAMMPAAMQTLKISDEQRLNRRKLLAAMFLAILIAMPLGFYSNLRATYALGATKTNAWTGWGLEASPPYPFAEASKAMQNPLGPDWHGITFMVIGAATMGLLFLLRYLFVWWPIHPIGMTLMGSWALYKLWFSALLASIIKAIVLRYGGLKLYNRLKPVFLGIIFAGFVIPAIILIVNILVGSELFDVNAWP